MWKKARVVNTESLSRCLLLAVPLSVGHRARAVLQPAVYEEMPATGHGPYLENPAVFNGILQAFLAERLPRLA